MQRPETRYAWNGEVLLAYQVEQGGWRRGEHRPRVAAIAAPSEVLVSQTVKDLMVGCSDLRFEDRGSHELKGVPGAWKVYAVAR